MASPEPIALLKNTLKEHENSLNKSIRLFKESQIDFETHMLHKRNLTKLIEQYKLAIHKLEK